MATLTQDQVIALLNLLNDGKLISELTEQLTIDTDDNFAAINVGTSDAKKVKVPLLRGVKGTYDANTNTPTLTNGNGLDGDIYVVSVAGSRDFGAGNVELLENDIIIYLNGKYLKTNGISSGGLNLQIAYDNSDPKTIEVEDFPTGTLTIKDSSTNENRDKIFEILKNDGITSLFYVENDNIFINGDLGVGTQTPSEKLEVDGNAKIDGKIYTKELIIDPNTTTTTLSGSISTIKNESTSTSTNVTEFIDVNRDNATENLTTVDNYGQVVRIESDSTFEDRLVISSNFVSRKLGSGKIKGLYAILSNSEYDGSGDVDFLTSIVSETLVKGNQSGVIDYARGVSTDVTILNSNSTVNYAQSQHLSLGIGGGSTVGNAEVLLLDFDVTDTSGGTILNDFSYLKIKNDNFSNLTINGDAYAIYSSSTLKSYLEGSLGIGTPSPLSKFTVQKSDDTEYDSTEPEGQKSDGSTIMVFNPSTSTDSFSQILFRSRSSSVGTSRIVSISTGGNKTDLAFVTEDDNILSEKMRITSEGDLGVGTETPTEKLEVKGRLFINPNTQTIGSEKASAIVFQSTNFNGSATAKSRITSFNNSAHEASMEFQVETSNNNYHTAIVIDNFNNSGDVRVSIPGTIQVDESVLLQGRTYAQLPNSPQEGMLTYITDASNVSYRATASGGGTDKCQVFYDGNNWIYV